MMQPILIIPALLVGFFAVVGFILSQLYFNEFSIHYTFTGISGLACAVCALLMGTNRKWTPAWAFWICISALLGVALDVYTYYVYYDIPGNHYAWPLIILYAGCILLITYAVVQRRAKLLYNAGA